MKLSTPFQTIPDKSQLKVSAVNWFAPGQDHVLEIEFDGPLYDTNDGGFFYYTYKVDDFTNKTVVSTVFEPAMARRMFPCFDDPFFKAWYHLKVISPKGAAVFHTTLEWDRQYYSETKDIVTFKKTPPVSSYLFSVSVGDFGFSRATTTRNIPIRSITFSEQANYTKETAQISANCVDAFESLVGYNFPLEKLDNIDTHLFFHGGGIENFGLILYTDVLPQLWPILSTTDVLGVQSIICHENSHQWMGDLVTTTHWGGEFLHESFANFFSYRMIQTFTDDKDYVEMDFQLERYGGFLSTLDDNHPIAYNMSNFDGTTYSAGCSVLRMLEGVISTNDFYAIINKYLNKFAFGNANMDDLIDLITVHFKTQTLCADLTYGEFLRDFLTNYYYPIVTVDKNGNFKQRSANETVFYETWNIPLFVWNERTHSQQVFWLRKGKYNTICSPTNEQLPSNAILNYHGLSFAAIQYSADYWEDLLKIDYSQVDEHTILGLLTDLSLDNDLQTTKGQESIQSRLIKKLLADYNGNLAPQIIELMLIIAEVNPQVTTTILDAAYPHVNWDPKTLREGAFAEVVLSLAVRKNIKDAKSKAGDYFAQFMKDCAGLKDIEICNKLNPNIRRSVYCAGAFSTDEATKDFMAAYYQKVSDLYESKFYLRPEHAKAKAGNACAPKSSQTIHQRRLALRQDPRL
ncbi:Thyrotropin-releasing hormone-degrading ectoenzyme [Aphelenchoides bicaudatus]|nr:Thyrotropin-releasing hormone-degrading ectoenzyme [Aphelenchoides bicaudatus]